MTPRKLGRNDPCWFGSEQKFKRCYLNRESHEPVARWDET